MIPGIRHGDDACQLVGVGDQRTLATILGTSLHELRDLRRNPNNYVSFTTKTGGKLRDVTAPKPRLEAVQRRIHDRLEMLPHPDYLHSDQRRRSHVTHASAHSGDQWLCKLDLRKCFDQVTTDRVRHFFEHRLRCADNVASMLAELCTTEGHLATGSRPSQRLAFLVAQPMFDELQRLADAIGVRFTLYVDDLCFSGARATPSFLWEVKQVVHRHGYRYHEAKCYRPEQPKLVTGVMLMARGSKLRARDALRIREALPARDIAGLEELRGRLSAAVSIDESYRPLLKATTAKLRTLRQVAAPSQGNAR